MARPKQWVPISYDAGHLEKMLELTRAYYGPDNDTSQQAFIQHEYFENPAGDALIDLAWDEEREMLAGQYVVWPMRYQVFGNQPPCVCSLNTLTADAYRGQGVFTGLAEYTYARGVSQDFGFCYGMPNPNSYPGFVGKLHFQKLGQIPLLLRPLRPSAMVQEFLHSAPLSALVRPFDGCFTRKAVPAANTEIIPITGETVSKMDAFWKMVSGKYPVMNLRDSAYIRFRYLDMPRRNYTLLLAVQGGIPVAFAAGRIMEVAGMQCAMLADFLFADGNASAATALLHTLLRQMQAEGASVAGSLMLPHTQESALLKRHGFFRCPRKMEPQPFPLILRLFDPALENSGICQLSNWFFTMGDYDVI